MDTFTEYARRSPGRATRFDEPGAPSTERHHVGDTERLASAIGGGLLALYGLRRRDLPGALLAIAGGVLLHHGVRGRSLLDRAIGASTADGGIPLVQQHGASAVLDARLATKVERAVTISGRSPEQLYRFWRNLENLPRVMRHLESVTVIDDQRSRWTVKGPAGQTVEWEAIIHNEIPNQLIAWRSDAQASVPNAGSVHFTPAPGGRDTEVRVVLEYAPPAGKLGELIAKAFRDDPESEVREDMLAFKEMMETGEIATS
jgi:uncharacterized membrane protein